MFGDGNCVDVLVFRGRGENDRMKVWCTLSLDAVRYPCIVVEPSVAGEKRGGGNIILSIFFGVSFGYRFSLSVPASQRRLHYQLHFLFPPSQCFFIYQQGN